MSALSEGMKDTPPARGRKHKTVSPSQRGLLSVLSEEEEGKRKAVHLALLQERIHRHDDPWGAEATLGAMGVGEALLDRVETGLLVPWDAYYEHHKCRVSPNMVGIVMRQSCEGSLSLCSTKRKRT